MIHVGDCRDILPTLGLAVDAVVCDPPYGLEFMDQDWDRVGGGRRGKPGIGERPTDWVSNRGWNDARCRTCGHLPHGGSPCRCENPDIVATDDRWQRWQEWNRTWAVEVYRAMKPGAYLLAFGGTRTFHRLTCAIEDAGFEIKDCLCWLYGQGMPKHKSLLKPAWEPIVVAKKRGPGGLNIGDCFLDGTPDATRFDPARHRHEGWRYNATGAETAEAAASRPGRWPANVALDEDAAAVLDAQSGHTVSRVGKPRSSAQPGVGWGTTHTGAEYDDAGGASRFFYVAKASAAERGHGNDHPTVKPLALMRWLVRLACPPGGTVLDPFAGSGSTGVACRIEGRGFVGIELSDRYAEIARRRIGDAFGPLFAGVVVVDTPRSTNLT